MQRTKKIGMRLAAVAGLVLMMAAPAAGQTPTLPDAADSPIWRAQIGAQLAHTLATGNAETRIETMQLIIQLGTQQDVLDLEAAVPQLMYIYRHNRRQAHRMMALSALRATGSAAAITQLTEVVEREKSGMVRRATLAAIAEHQTRL